MDEPTDKPGPELLDYGKEPSQSWKKGRYGMLVAFFVACFSLGIFNIAAEALLHDIAKRDSWGILLGLIGFGIGCFFAYRAFCMAWTARHFTDGEESRTGLYGTWLGQQRRVIKPLFGLEIAHDGPRRWHEGRKGGLVGFVLVAIGFPTCMFAFGHIGPAYAERRWIALLPYGLLLCVGTGLMGIGGRLWRIAARYRDEP